MKAVVSLLSLIFALHLAQAGHTEAVFDTTRVFEQVYEAGLNDILEVQSQYGSVTVTSWNEPRIAVKVTISASGVDAAKVRSLISQVVIRERRFGSKIQLETVTPGSSLVSWASRNGLRIRYEIQAPASTPMEINHRFGDVEISDWQANLDLHIEQGQLTAGNLMGAGNRIHLTGGKAVIASIAGGDAYFSAGSQEIGWANALSLNANMGKTVIGFVDQLQVSGSLGEVRIDTVNQISGNYSTGKLFIGRLNTSAMLDGKFASRIEIATVTPTIQSVQLNGEFSSFAIGLDPETAIDLEAQMENGEVITALENQEIRRVQLTSRVEVVKTLPEESARRASQPAPVKIYGKFGSVRIYQ